MRKVGDYRDTCGACVHFIRDEEREREQAEIWPWTAGWPVHACGLSRQVVESLDSPNACGSAAEGCAEFERRGRG
jgi:hypothetical protein